MPFVKITGETRVFTKPRQWDEAAAGPCGDLSVREDTYGPYHQLNFAWKPDVTELAALNAGGHIEVHLVHDVMPPVGVSVIAGDAPADNRPAITIDEKSHGFE